MSIRVCWAQVFVLPRSVIHEIERCVELLFGAERLTVTNLVMFHGRMCVSLERSGGIEWRDIQI